MKKPTAAALILAGALLILDSRCASQSASEALGLWALTLVPNLFPLFVVSAMLVPGLRGLRIPILSRMLGFPAGSEGIWLLGLCGGFPVGAACTSQAVSEGSLRPKDAERMLGLCSLCGPAFLFGILPRFLPMEEVFSLFLIQAQTSLLLGALWPGASRERIAPSAESVSLPQAVRRAIDSLLCVCGWVTLAGVASGFLRKWLFPFLPHHIGVILTGLLELTNGIFALPVTHRFLLCTLFVCFGGVSVLLQIGGLAGSAGLRMGTCIQQKIIQALMGTVLAAAYIRLGNAVFLLIPALLFVKMTLEIPGDMVYNTRERKGSRCCFAKRWSAPASTAGSARR